MRYGHRASDYGDLREMYMRTRAEGFGAEVKRRIMVGAYVLSHGYYDAYYVKAQQLRRLIADDSSRVFGEVDLIAGPVSPTTAWRIGEQTDDPVRNYLADIFTLPASLAGLPAMSVPCGFGAGGLPVGLQLIAPYLRKATASCRGLRLAAGDRLASRAPSPAGRGRGVSATRDAQASTPGRRGVGAARLIGPAAVGCCWPPVHGARRPSADRGPLADHLRRQLRARRDDDGFREQARLDVGAARSGARTGRSRSAARAPALRPRRVPADADAGRTSSSRPATAAAAGCWSTRTRGG